jgi:hypothetical protein
MAVAAAGVEPTPGNISYALGPVAADAAQLAEWHGTATDENLLVSGPCPACGHDSPQFVPLKVTALEAYVVQTVPVTLPVTLTCTCGAEHAGQPGTRNAGCGRSWPAVATVEAGLVTLEPGGASGLAGITPADAARQAAIAVATRAVQEGAASQLATVTDAAQKWIAGVAAMFGLFSLAGVTLTRSAVTALTAPWQVVVALLGLASVALAGCSVYLMYRAAYGWPVTVDVGNADSLLAWYDDQQKQPRRRADRMRMGVHLAVGSLAAVVATAGVLWFGPQQQAASRDTQATLTSGTIVCGTLLAHAADGVTVIRRASDGTAIRIPLRRIAALTAVASC